MKREREKHITRLHIILFFLVITIGLTVFIVVKAHLGGNIQDYKDFESEIVNASKLYYKINQMNIKNGYEKRINIKKLNDQGLLQNDLVSKCKGYALLSSERDIYTQEYSIEYTAYIKCGSKYTTVNYSEY